MNSHEEIQNLRILILILVARPKKYKELNINLMWPKMNLSLPLACFKSSSTPRYKMCSERWALLKESSAKKYTCMEEEETNEIRVFH